MNIMDSHHDAGKARKASSHLPLTILLSAMLVIALYAVARYQGLWGETDTASFTRSMQAISGEGKLYPGNSAYAHGYGYPILGFWFSQIAGIRLSTFQLYVAILLAPWVILPAWLFYREITSSSKTATLATLILLIQPEFLFPLLRGTHEKFTRGLMLVCLYLFVRSWRSQSNLRRLLGFTLAFYLCAFGLVTFNVFLMTSFLAALAIATIFSWLAAKWLGTDIMSESRHFKWLGYKISTLFVLVFMFVFYIYPPSQVHIRILSSMADQLVTLFLGAEQAATNPYTVVNEGWINLPVYLLLSISNWLLLLSSMLVWLGSTWRMIRRRYSGSWSDLFLWALYASFAFEGALSIAIDFSGSVATNLQHRIFPSFAMLAAPLVARWLIKLPASKTGSKLVRIGLPVGISILALLAVLKATSEPLLSHKWNFHLPGEAQAVRWAETALPGRGLWTGFDERVNVSVAIRGEGLSPNLELDQYDLEPETRNVLISSLTRLRSQRLVEILPVKPDDLLTYDNGAVQIFHLRPRTPFQW